MNCINMKVKLNHTLYCKKYNKEIKLSDCKHCKLLEYATIQQNHIKMNKYSQNNKHSLNGLKTPLKKVSKKQAKMERERFSIIDNNNKDKCMLCSSTYHLTWHELYCGRNKANSMKYGLCLRLCNSCHSKYQNDAEFNDYWHKKGQVAFGKAYPDLYFEDIFKINYL